jgi:hypothetical protein
LNYLSHYYIDSKEGNYYYNSALFLPDFVRNYAKGFEYEQKGLDANQLQLQLGCKAHLKADKVFHPSSFFKNYSQLVNSELQQFKPLAHLNRKWFLAHILFEMLIDRLLINHFPDTCHAFYNDLSSIDTNTLEKFVMSYSFKNIDQLMRNFKHFCEVKYLFGYTYNDSFVFSIARVYKQAANIEMSMGDKYLLKVFIDNIENQYFNDPLMIVAQLKQVFNNNLN